MNRGFRASGFERGTRRSFVPADESALRSIMDEHGVDAVAALGIYLNEPEPVVPTEHRIRWFVYVTGDDGRPERIPRESSMRGQWDYDAVCSCGWDSRTGGGLERAVRELVDEHKRGLRLR